MRKIDNWLAKSFFLAAIFLFFMPLFFLLNNISSQNAWIFIVVVFCCNIVYDSIKKVMFSKIYSIGEWVSIVKLSWSGILCIVISFAGIYIDIFVFNYIGVSFIWFPSFLTGMFLVSKAEYAFRKAYSDS